MLHSFLDHLVVTAPTLEAGSRYIEARLGVKLEEGGRHSRMGTHNRLLKLGPTLYLEVIAIDPCAPVPDRPRWFSLDCMDAETPPHLTAWIARTERIAELPPQFWPTFGKPETMSRGTLEWSITIPENGAPPFGGIAPMLIQWPPDTHPAARLEEAGCSLARFEGIHPHAEPIRALLDAIGFAGGMALRQPAPGETAHLAASIQTPGGIRQL